MLSYRGGALFALVIGVLGVSAFIAMNSKRKRRKRSPPKNMKWKEVGQLENIWLYPLKSGRYIELNEADLTPTGIREIPNSSGKYQRRDRSFIVQRDDNHEMVTARLYPILIKIKLETINSNLIKFQYPGTDDFIIDTNEFERSYNSHVMMWNNEKVHTVDCGDKASSWISDILNSEYKIKTKFRIGYWPYSQKNRRDVIKPDSDRAAAFQELTIFDSGAYADLASFMLMTSSSVDDLRQKVSPLEISILQFRPNFYIKTITPEPFQEDNWTWIKIGDNVFRNVKPCTRCIFVNINPETGSRNPQFEPLKTLKLYRQLKEPIQRKVEGDSPVMGINLGLVEACSSVSKGDCVYASTD